MPIYRYCSVVPFTYQRKQKASLEKDEKKIEEKCATLIAQTARHEQVQGSWKSLSLSASPVEFTKILEYFCINKIIAAGNAYM